MQKWMLILLLSLTSFVGLAQQTEPQDSQGEQQEMLTHFPNWALYTESGELVTSEDFLGKPLVVHFWGTWCPYCKRLQPGLDRIHKAYKDKGLQMIAIAIREKPGATPQKVLDERGLSMKTVVEGDELAIRELGIDGTPTTFFIAPDGTIIGATMQSDPDDPRLAKIAEYMVSLPRT